MQKSMITLPHINNLIIFELGHLVVPLVPDVV